MTPADVAAAMLSLITNSAKFSTDIVNQVIAANLAQGLGVIQSVLVLQHGGVGDDPALIAALQTAAGSPRQGAITGGGTP